MLNSYTSRKKVFSRFNLPLPLPFGMWTNQNFEVEASKFNICALFYFMEIRGLLNNGQVEIYYDPILNLDNSSSGSTRFRNIEVKNNNYISSSDGLLKTNNRKIIYTRTISTPANLRGYPHFSIEYDVVDNVIENYHYSETCNGRRNGYIRNNNLSCEIQLKNFIDLLIERYS